MSVIIGRALPDARDGLKPAHRRVLYGMKTMGLSVDARLSQVREDRRRGDGQFPSPRRRRRSTTRSCAWRRTSTCAIRWSTARATSDRSTAIRRRRCGTRRRASVARRRHDGGSRQRDRRLRAELRRDHRRADGAAGAVSEPARQRIRRHRRRHGDQRAAAQPARSHRRLHLADREHAFRAMRRPGHRPPTSCVR